MKNKEQIEQRIKELETDQAWYTSVVPKEDLSIAVLIACYRKRKLQQEIDVLKWVIE